MHDNSAIKALKKRFDELERAMTPVGEQFIQAQTAMMIEEDREQQREIDFVYAAIYTPIEPIKLSLYVDIVSALKTLDNYLPSCRELYLDTTEYLQQNLVEEHEHTALTEMSVSLRSIMFGIIKNTKVYLAYYEACDAELKSKLHAVFSEHPILAEWFLVKLNAENKSASDVEQLSSDEEAHYTENDSENESELPPIRAFFENSAVAISSKPNLDTLFTDTARTIRHFKSWLCVIKKFNAPIEEACNTYADEIFKYANNCCNFSKIKEFINKLRQTVFGLECYIAERVVIAEEKEELAELMTRVRDHIKTLDEHVNDFTDMMRKLAEHYEDNQDELTPLLHRFMQPWLDGTEDPITASANIIGEFVRLHQNHEDQRTQAYIRERRNTY